MNEERDDGTTDAPVSVARLLNEVDREQLPLAEGWSYSKGDAPLVAEEVEVSIAGADRHLEFAGQVGGPERLPAL